MSVSAPPPRRDPVRPEAADRPRVTVSAMSSAADARAFKELNEEWIRSLFTLEAADRLVLDDPEGSVVARGGVVLMAREDGRAVGCVALVPTGGGVFELSKMSVSPATRGRGVGRTLVLAAIGAAEAMGATSVFLGSSTRLADAVHLYESVGFRHVPREELGPLPYVRADVFMRYPIGETDRPAG